MEFCLTGNSTATNANYIVTLENILWRLGYSPSMTSSLSAITSQVVNEIGYVSCGIEDYTNKKIVPQELIYFDDGDGSNILYPAFYPIQSIVSLQIRTTISSGWTDITNDVDIVPNMKSIMLKTFVFPASERSVKIDYIAGYNPIPEKIKEVAIEQIALGLRESQIPTLGKNLLGVSSRTITTQGQGNTVQFLSRLTDEHKSILNKYKTISVPKT